MSVTTTFTSLPESTATRVRSGKYGPYGQTHRDVETRWVLNPEAEGVPQVVVDLTTYHSGDRKEFYSRLTWGTVETTERHPNDGPGTFSVYRWASDHASVLVHFAPVARYSKKAMEEYHGEALRVAEEHFHDGVSAVFDEAVERNGLNSEEE